MKKFHIAISVQSIEQSVIDYSQRLGKEPDLIIEENYALWRTKTLNFSIRQESNSKEKLRHLGWEDSNAESFSEDTDVNNILWEKFSASHQAKEISEIWPDKQYTPNSDY